MDSRRARASSQASPASATSHVRATARSPPRVCDAHARYSRRLIARVSIQLSRAGDRVQSRARSFHRRTMRRAEKSGIGSACRPDARDSPTPAMSWRSPGASTRDERRAMADDNPTRRAAIRSSPRDPRSRHDRGKFGRTYDRACRCVTRKYRPAAPSTMSSRFYRVAFMIARPARSTALHDTHTTHTKRPHALRRFPVARLLRPRARSPRATSTRLVRMSPLAE